LKECNRASKEARVGKKGNRALSFITLARTERCAHEQIAGTLTQWTAKALSKGCNRASKEARAGKRRNRALAATVARATKAARAAKVERVERAGVSLGVVKGEEDVEVAKAASTAAIVAAREAAEAVAKADTGNKA
jgi:hypothetical protein